MRTIFCCGYADLLIMRNLISSFEDCDNVTASIPTDPSIGLFGINGYASQAAIVNDQKHYIIGGPLKNNQTAAKEV